jgi:hypothetical protein
MTLCPPCVISKPFLVFFAKRIRPNAPFNRRPPDFLSKVAVTTSPFGKRSSHIPGASNLIYVGIPYTVLEAKYFPE